jgi:hypothetical protein
MNARFLRLDAIVIRIQKDVSVLDAKVDELHHLLAHLNTKLEATASASDMTEVKRHLRRKPGTWKIALVTLVVGCLLVAAALETRPFLLKWLETNSIGQEILRFPR